MNLGCDGRNDGNDRLRTLAQSEVSPSPALCDASASCLELLCFFLAYPDSDMSDKSLGN